MIANWRNRFLIAALLAPAALQADDTLCHGGLQGRYDNVIVPEGAVCELRNAHIKGSVLVKRDGALVISGRSSINGNVISEDGGRYVRIVGRRVRVGGNVQIKGNYEHSVIERGTTIRGSLQYVENDGELSVSGVFIDSDLQLFKNSGGAVLTDNTIRQNMQCKENHPPPVGGGNVAEKMEDQCRPL